MNYRYMIDPELRKIAKRIPYNKVFIKMAKFYQTIAWRFTKIPDGVSCKQFSLNGYLELPFKAEMFEPANSPEKLPCFLYIHGGAFSYKASAHHKKLACQYALKANCRVILPDYHLLPKYPYPAAYQDVLALYKWVLANGSALNIDMTRIGIGGDSAGAALTALLCNTCEKENLPVPCAQMLIYPATDATMRTKSMREYPDTPLWNSICNRRMWKYYLNGATEEYKRNASPMQNTLPSQLPDTYLETAELDCLHDEGIIYALKLKDAGVNVTVNNTRGTIHGYDAAVNTQITRNNVEKRTDFLRKCFSL